MKNACWYRSNSQTLIQYNTDYIGVLSEVDELELKQPQHWHWPFYLSQWMHIIDSVVLMSWDVLHVSEREAYIQLANEMKIKELYLS